MTHTLRTIADLRPGDHLCCLYETEEEHQAVLTSFLRQGLERGEKVIYIVDARTAETVLGYLRDDGLAPEPHLVSGQLTILTSDDTYLREGAFDPDGMIAHLRSGTEQALAEGYPALRVAGEMTWVLRGLPGSERLIEYESKLNEFFPGSRCMGLCQYDRRRFDPAVLLDVLRTHPLAIVGTEVYGNFYYMPPGERLAHDLPAVELRRWVQNLAERKRAEEALQRSEQKFKDLTETTTDWVWEVDAQGVYTYASPKVKDLLGYEVSEVVGKTPFDLIPGEEAKRIREFFDERVVTQQPFYSLENVNRHKDGHLIVLETSGIPIFDERGQLKGYRGIDRDITERKEAERALEQRVTQLAILNDIGGKVAAVLELDSVLDRTAYLVQESFGYHHVGLFTLDRERGELMMRARAGDFAHLYPPDHWLKLSQGMVGWVGRHGERLLANDVRTEPHYVNLYPDVIPTRSELSVPIRVGEETVGVLDVQSPRLNAFDENDVMVMETLADQIAVAIENARLYKAVQQELLERKRAEESLRESEARYRTVSELTSDFAYAVRVEPDGTLVPEWATEAFTRITGFTPGAVFARGGWESLIHPDDAPIALRHLQVHLSGQPDVAEYRIVVKSGEARWLRDYGRPVWDEAQGRVVRIYGAGQDITERKRMERYVLRTERLAAMGHMAAALAHEIKNPLQSLQSHLELVLDFALEPDEREEYLRFCCQEIEHLTEITERVLGFARPASDTPYPASIVHLTQRVLALIGKPLQHARVQVTTDFPIDLPPVLVLPDRIIQVLLNLIINAIESIPDSGHVHIAARTAGDMLVLTLTNDGPPIPLEHIEHIFDPFFTTKPDGTGLGLFISHSIVGQHGGTISVENQRDNQGVTFTITLPIAHPAEGQEAVKVPVLSDALSPVLSLPKGLSKGAAEGAV